MVELKFSITLETGDVYEDSIFVDIKSMYSESGLNFTEDNIEEAKRYLRTDFINNIIQNHVSYEAYWALTGEGRNDIINDGFDI